MYIIIRRELLGIAITEVDGTPSWHRASGHANERISRPPFLIHLLKLNRDARSSTDAEQMSRLTNGVIKNFNQGTLLDKKLITYASRSSKVDN